MDAYEVIKRPVITEKTHGDAEDTGTYVFEVADGASKTDIREAIESLWDVKVKDVRTLNVTPKPKRFRWQKVGYTRVWKKAYVRLAEGQAIDALK